MSVAPAVSVQHLESEIRRLRQERDKAVRFALLLGRVISDQVTLGFHGEDGVRGAIRVTFLPNQVRLVLKKYHEVLSTAVEKELERNAQDPAQAREEED